MLLDEVGVERSFLSRGVRRVAIRQHNIRQETQPCRRKIRLQKQNYAQDEHFLFTGAALYALSSVLLISNKF